MNRSKIQRRIVLLAALAAAIVSFLAISIGRRPILLTWWRWQAVRECREPDFDPRKPPSPGWRAIFEAGESGYPALASLLCDPDPQVEAAAWQIIDKNYGNQEPFLEYLRSTSTLATVKYLLPVPEGLTWRARSGEPESSVDWLAYWCGKNRTSLEPSKEAIDLLEFSLKIGAQNIRYHALFGLTSMIEPEEVANPKTPLAARIVEILARAVHQGPACDAVLAIVLRSMPEDNDHPRPWVPTSRDWVDMASGVLEMPAKEKFRARRALLSLCHVDEAVTLTIIARLLRDPAMRPSVEAILAERPRLGPLEMPTWQPPLEAARRFFRRGGREALEAAGLLAEENLREGKSLIEEAMAGEPDREITLYYRSCLLALGDETQRQAARQFFKELLEEPEAPITHEVCLQEIAPLLLWGGDLPALEWLISSLLQAWVDFGEFIDDFPRDLRLNPHFRPSVDLELKRKLAAWWAANKDRIAFDPARRKFFVR